MSKRGSFLYGIIKGNPILVLMIGLCPVLAITTTLYNGIGMSVAVAFVLTGSNLLISAMRKVIPNEIRIPVFIVIISTFVTVTDYLMAGFLPDLHEQLGVFVPLIVVNCIILGRAEAFAYHNSIIDSILDGLGTSLGFGIVVILISGIREILGNGTILGYRIFENPAMIMALPPGGFIVIGFLLLILYYIQKKRK